MGRTAHGVLSQIEPLFNIILELVGMTTTVERDKISDSVLEADLVGSLGREIKEVGHDHAKVRTSANWTRW